LKNSTIFTSVWTTTIYIPVEYWDFFEHVPFKAPVGARGSLSRDKGNSNKMTTQLHIKLMS